jgi:hypothetical protein
MMGTQLEFVELWLFILLFFSQDISEPIESESDTDTVRLTDLTSVTLYSLLQEEPARKKKRESKRVEITPMVQLIPDVLAEVLAKVTEICTHRISANRPCDLCTWYLKGLGC